MLTTIHVASQLLVRSGMTSRDDLDSFGAMLSDLTPGLVATPAAAVNNAPEAPPEFICPITNDVMKEAVIVVGTGNTYEKVAIQDWFARGNFKGNRANLFL
jgi:hypothetical protein